MFIHFFSVSLAVISLPEEFFNTTQRIRIASNSVIVLYCEANSIYSSLSMMWFKDNIKVVQDLPRVYTKQFTTGSSTTLILVIRNFQHSDNGQYQCRASNALQDTVGGNQARFEGNNSKWLLINIY